MHHRVAKNVARAWKRRINSLRYEESDLYQDAMELIPTFEPKHDPARGHSLEKYLTQCCIYRIGDRLTRAVSPAGTRSNSEVTELRHLVAVRVDNTDLRDDLDYDHIVWLTQVRERMVYLARGDVDALNIALDRTTVRAVTDDPEESRLLHQRVRVLKRRMMKDNTLYSMLKAMR